jgi:4-amino-4-deoxy-L-arabinose transferase-like glycosyltransferase
MLNSPREADALDAAPPLPAPIPAPPHAPGPAPEPDVVPAPAAREDVYVRVRRRVEASLAHPRAPLALLGAVSLLSIGARVFHLDIPSESSPGQGFIFDEKYYVNASRVVAGVPMSSIDTYANASPAGTDPNGEHPQLGKVIIAATIRLFGDNPVGWRIGAVVFGTAAILLLYWLVRCLGGSSWLALGVASLAAVENLWLVSGRIAVLDIFCVPFMLAGVAFYLRRQPVVAGVLLGVGMCIKEFTVYALFAILLLEAVKGARWLIWERAGATTLAPAAAGAAMAVPTRRGLWEPDLGFWRQPVVRRVAMPVVVGFVWLATFFSLLAVLDKAITPYHDNHPVDSGQAAICDHALLWSGSCNHFAFMNQYAKDLRSSNGPQGIASYPWQFWGDVEPINYYTVTTTVRTGDVVTAVNTVVAFQGLIHPVILVTAWIAILITLWWAIRWRDDLSIFTLVWIIATWLPAEGFSLIGQRTTYLYYMVVTMPALFIAVARVLARREIPRWVVGMWVGILLTGFAILYPFRTFTGT